MKGIIITLIICITTIILYYIYAKYDDKNK